MTGDFMIDFVEIKKLFHARLRHKIETDTSYKKNEGRSHYVTLCDAERQKSIPKLRKGIAYNYCFEFKI